MACSPSLNPETDELRDLYENYEHRANMEDLWELCALMERERNEARREAIRWQDAWMNETTLHEMGSTLMPWMHDWKQSQENATVQAIRTGAPADHE